MADLDKYRGKEAKSMKPEYLLRYYQGTGNYADYAQTAKKKWTAGKKLMQACSTVTAGLFMNYAMMPQP